MRKLGEIQDLGTEAPSENMQYNRVCSPLGEDDSNW